VDALEALHNRTASPRLIEPAPSLDQLQSIYKAALRAPDHGMLRPWRFLVVEGDARSKLGELFVECMQPEDEAKHAKLLNAPLRAPLIIIAVTEFKEHPKVPKIEQVGATAAAVQNMSLAAHALGYSSIWRTGPVAFEEKVKVGLGLNPQDEIVAYLYIGTPTVAERPVPENAIADYFETWG
jgi:nitroreductase